MICRQFCQPGRGPEVHHDDTEGARELPGEITCRHLDATGSHSTFLEPLFSQLIVITHDEKFAHLIGTRENTEVMWRITKDELQHTKIEAEVVP